MAPLNERLASFGRQAQLFDERDDLRYSIRRSQMGLQAGTRIAIELQQRWLRVCGHVIAQERGLPWVADDIGECYDAGSKRFIESHLEGPSSGGRVLSGLLSRGKYSCDPLRKVIAGG